MQKQPFWRSDTFRLLRVPFSVNLMPFYWFALSESAGVTWWAAASVFVILHGLVYPASNGYNSYMDRDTSPIGGLEHPPPPTRRLFRVTLLLDALALAWALALHWLFALLLLGYILASRAYSYRGIRLKKYPIVGFLTVFVFQGGYTFLMAWQGIGRLDPAEVAAGLSLGAPDGRWLCLLVSSLLVGGGYPLTQIYQHEADRASGDRTLSLMLGYRGTVVFAAALFGLGFALLSFQWLSQGASPWLFGVFALSTAPVLLYFQGWAWAVWHDPRQATFRRTMRMNLLSALCLNGFFLLLAWWNA